MLKICLASDHRGVHIKAKLMQSLAAAGFTVSDEGTNSDTACDYPDLASLVAKKVSSGEADRGILICGTGIGMAITANKFLGVRAASCYDEVLIEMSRRHNDVNVLCLPGDLIGERPIDDLVLLWLKTEFDGGRHNKRVQKICTIEKANLRCDSAAAESAEPSSGPKGPQR